MSCGVSCCPDLESFGPAAAEDYLHSFLSWCVCIHRKVSDEEQVFETGVPEMGHDFPLIRRAEPRQATSEELRLHRDGIVTRHMSKLIPHFVRGCTYMLVGTLCFLDVCRSHATYDTCLLSQRYPLSESFTHEHTSTRVVL